ncbi:hypothetical protein [Paraburkholderia aromaticivorans]|nr:hypothetical protein [Paraburkholderia aromaticivorans]
MARRIHFLITTTLLEPDTLVAAPPFVVAFWLTGCGGGGAGAAEVADGAG